MLALALLTACAPEVQVDPAVALERVPDWQLEPEAGGGVQASGPIVEAGSGVLLGVGWRYALFESELGWCRQLETQEVTETRCGDPAPPEDAALALVSRMELSTGADAIAGLSIPEVATVWVVLEGQNRFPAMSLQVDVEGLEQVPFVAVVPPELTATHLLAVARNGEVLETLDLQEDLP